MTKAPIAGRIEATPPWQPALVRRARYLRREALIGEDLPEQTGKGQTWGRGDAGLVPGGACTACCHYPHIVVDERRDRKRLAHLLTERSPEGELVLQRRSNGACVHLGERGCTVYEQRPAVCRTFDCRVFAAMGLVERCGPSHQTPGWEFAGC